MAAELPSDDDNDDNEGSYPSTLRRALRRLRSSESGSNVMATVTPEDEEEEDEPTAHVLYEQQVPRLAKLLHALVDAERAVVTTPAARAKRRRSRALSEPTRGTKRNFDDEGALEEKPRKRSRVTFASAEIAVWDMAEDPLPPPTPNKPEPLLEHLHAALAAADEVRDEVLQSSDDEEASPAPSCSSENMKSARSQVEGLVSSLRLDSSRAARFLASELEVLCARREEEEEDEEEEDDGRLSMSTVASRVSSSCRTPTRKRRRSSSSATSAMKESSSVAWRHAEVLSSVLRRELKLLLNESVSITPGTGSVRFNFDDPAALLHRALALIAESGGPNWPASVSKHLETVEDAQDILAVASAHGFAIAVLTNENVRAKVKKGDFAAVESLAGMVRTSGEGGGPRTNSLMALSLLRDFTGLAKSLEEASNAARDAASEALEYLSNPPDVAPPPVVAEPDANKKALSKRARKKLRRQKKQAAQAKDFTSSVFLYPEIVTFDPATSYF